MNYPYLTIWHLAVIPVVWLLIVQRSKRRELFWGGMVALPILLLLPILSPTYFGLFSSKVILGFFVGQAVTVFSLGVLAAALYEKALRPRVTRQPHQPRHHFLTFGFGLALALIIFDILGQPFLPSLLYGFGLNLLLALRYYPEEIYDILFSTILMAFFYVFVYSAVLFDLPGEVGRFWLTDSLSGLTLFGLAIEKVMTIASFGAFWGPLYVGLKDVSKR